MSKKSLWSVFAVLVILGPGWAGSELDDATQKLKSSDYKERLSAIRELEAIGGKKAAKALVGAIDDSDWAVQIRALQALGNLKVRDTLEPVAMAGLKGQIILVRQAAVEALNKMGEPTMFARMLKGVSKGGSVEEKIRALESAEVLAVPSDLDSIVVHTGSREMKVKAAAFRALGWVKGEKAVKYALRGLRDRDVTVRVAAGEALGDLGGTEALEGLLSLAISEYDPYVTERVARALRKGDPVEYGRWLKGEAIRNRKADARAKVVRLIGELEAAEAGEFLVSFLADTDPLVRAWAARGVAKCGHLAAADTLRKLAKEDEDVTVRRVSLETLVAMLPEKADRLDVLEQALKNEAAEIRIRACVLLRRAGGVERLSAVYPLVKEDDWFVATAAIITIGSLGHEDEVEVLASRVRDQDWKVRAAALEGLGQLRHMDVVPHLISGLEDKDHIVRGAALKNLQIIAQQPFGPRVANWEKWYELNKGKYELTKKGYRETVEDDYYAKQKYLIEILNKAQILCVLGKYDHAEWVLEHLSIKHDVIRPQEIVGMGLNPKQLMLINCEGTIGRKAAIERVQWFVHVGGYLMATDWALQNTIVRAFPGFIDRDSKSKTGNDVVKIEAHDPDHPLLKGVFDRTTQIMWWLEIIAFPMKVVDEFRTELLVDSLEMLQKYNASPMAAVFDYGHGKVEQCVSHFFLQEEGLTNRTTATSRKVFAADNLGISLDQIRELEAGGFFDGQVTEAMTKQIAEDYSMFKLIVNFVVAKRRQVEQQ